MSKALRRIQKWTVLAALICAGTAFAVPKKITFQGKLLDKLGKPVNTTSGQAMTFKIYKASGGSAIWTEVQVIDVKDGLYTVVLGATTPIDLPFNEDYLLGIKVGSDAEMAPRISLLTSAYAFRADTAEFVKNLPSVDSVRTAHKADSAMYVRIAPVVDSVRVSHHADSAAYVRNAPAVDSVRASRKADSAMAALSANTAVTAGTADSAGIAATAYNAYQALNASAADSAKNAKHADSAAYASNAGNAASLGGSAASQFLKKGDTSTVQLDSLKILDRFSVGTGSSEILTVDGNGVSINNRSLSLNNAGMSVAGDLSVLSTGRILLNGKEIDPGYQNTLDSILTTDAYPELSFDLNRGNVDVQSSYFEVTLMWAPVWGGQGDTTEFSLDGSNFSILDTNNYSNPPNPSSTTYKIWNVQSNNTIFISVTSDFYLQDKKTIYLSSPSGGLKSVWLRNSKGWQKDWTRITVNRIKR